MPGGVSKDEPDRRQLSAMVQMPTLEEVAALRQALAEAARLQADAARRNEALTGELRVVLGVSELFPGCARCE